MKGLYKFNRPSYYITFEMGLPSLARSLCSSLRYSSNVCTQTEFPLSARIITSLLQVCNINPDVLFHFSVNTGKAVCIWLYTNRSRSIKPMEKADASRDHWEFDDSGLQLDLMRKVIYIRTCYLATGVILAILGCYVIQSYLRGRHIRTCTLSIFLS